MTDNIPLKTTVLVVGGGPGGSYTATLLAREGIDVVLLEADVFPRYHIGESMLPSMRQFLRFIDLDDDFKAHGFHVKNGAGFKLKQGKREGYTNFIETGGPDGYSWNVIRSESDEILFRHAGKCGALIFDGVRVDSIDFAPTEKDGDKEKNSQSSNIGRPISAHYTRKADGVKGSIAFDYLVDASGRAGILSSRYFKNRKYNTALKNMAFWSYWEETSFYGEGTPRANSPYFEALTDESGWAWIIPLHDGTTSVGVVLNQDAATEKRAKINTKGDSDCTALEAFYHSSLELAPQLHALLTNGRRVEKIKSASDYSYSAPYYASPYARVVGDAGCFIDPFFSSGVHLALTSALSAAATICASIRGECDEVKAAEWHSGRVAEGYNRFLVVVLSAYRQMRRQDDDVLSRYYEDNFDEAFTFLRPIIQGTADLSTRISQSDLARSLDFCTKAWDSRAQPENFSKVIKRLAASDQQSVAANGVKGVAPQRLEDSDTLTGEKAGLTEEESAALEQIRARRVLRMDTTADWERLTTDVVDGFRIRLKRGSLGLESAKGDDSGVSGRAGSGAASDGTRLVFWSLVMSLLSVVAVVSCLTKLGLELHHLWR